METYGPTILFLLLVIVLFGRRVLIMVHPDVKNISSEEAYKLIRGREKILILDVRTPEEYAGGHIPGAVLIPVHELSRRIKEIQDYEEHPVLIYCASGGRSPKGVQILLKHKFSSIYHLSAGIFGWNYGLEAS